MATLGGLFITRVVKRRIHLSIRLDKITLKNLKGKSKSSQEWLTRQLNDPYVKKAHEMNYRARSAFKLIEMDDKLRILKPGITVVECGAAPGAWTQVVVQRTNSDGKNNKKPIGRVIGVDLLPIVPIHGAILLPGSDFTNPEVQFRIQQLLLSRMVKDEVKDGSSSDEATINPLLTKQSILTNQEPKQLLVDLVLSDMAPNATGNRDTDHPRIIKLVRIALKFAQENGKPGGHFLTKIWDGSESQKLEKELSTLYTKVSRFKPTSSRNDSAEMFLFAYSKLC